MSVNELGKTLVSVLLGIAASCAIIDMSVLSVGWYARRWHGRWIKRTTSPAHEALGSRAQEPRVK